MDMVTEETFRRAMVDEQIRRRGVRDKRLLAAMDMKCPLDMTNSTMKALQK